MDLTGAQSYITAQLHSDEKLARRLVELFTGPNWRQATKVLREIIENPKSRQGIDLSNILTAHLRQRYALKGPDAP